MIVPSHLREQVSGNHIHALLLLAGVAGEPLGREAGFEGLAASHGDDY